MENFNRIENTIILFAQAAEYTVAGLDKEDVITEENGGMRAYPLFPFGQVRNVEAFYIEFDAGVRHESLPHVAGAEEYVFLVKGTLTMVVGEKEVCLREKQSIRLGADISHAYHNVSDKACSTYNVIFYPNN
jgi:mannose-6-phosphate isomerase-like protein (cupin superfamily)